MARARSARQGSLADGGVCLDRRRSRVTADLPVDPRRSAVARRRTACLLRFLFEAPSDCRPRRRHRPDPDLDGLDPRCLPGGVLAAGIGDRGDAVGDDVAGRTVPRIGSLVRVPSPGADQPRRAGRRPLDRLRTLRQCASFASPSALGFSILSGWTDSRLYGAADPHSLDRRRLPRRAAGDIASAAAALGHEPQPRILVLHVLLPAAAARTDRRRGARLSGGRSPRPRR